MSDVKGGMEAVCRALRQDSGYYAAWQANIAMAFFDEWKKDRPRNSDEVHATANRAAKQFLDFLMRDEK